MTPSERLDRAWVQNACGDEACERRRLNAALAVLRGGTTHRQYADLVNERTDAPQEER